MPPKKPKRASTADWTWVKTEVFRPEDITSRDRRRAAGLEDASGQPSGSQCPLRYSVEPVKQAIVEHGLGLDAIKEGEGEVEGKEGIANGGSLCTAKRCREWHRCYNHIGAEEVIKTSKADWIAEKLGDGPEEREDGRHPGLRNLGATCYANAFLQVWYHNVELRNGVYTAAASTSPRSPLYQLAKVFASLAYSNRLVVDPTGLVDSLNLRKGDQQDAAEFSKLFTSLIDDAFKRQPDPKVKNLLSDLFEGKMRFITQCSRCEYKSTRDESFLELDINIKNNASIDECLREAGKAEKLEGDNRYHCPQCVSLQVATRQTIPSQLPKILNLCLMRFTYGNNGRIKSKAAIKYNTTMRFGGLDYALKAVVTHEGSSAHHGHFTADVFDESEAAWLHCNDEQVKRLDGKKRIRIMDEEDSRTRTSKDAYMLVYMRNDSIPGIDPPAEVLNQVLGENETLKAEIQERSRLQEVAEDDYGHITNAKKHVLEVLPGVGHSVPRDDLERWLKASTIPDLFTPWNMSPITCHHGGLDPHKIGNTRSVSAEAFDRLQVYSRIPDLEVCELCVETGFTQRSKATSLTEQLTEFDRLNKGDKDLVLPKAWLEAWKRGLTNGCTPNDDPYNLYCEHGGRGYTAQKVEQVSTAAVVLLQSVSDEHFLVYGIDEPLCPRCTEDRQGELDAAEAWKDAAKAEKGLKKLLGPSPPPFDVDFYAVPRQWYDDWEAWLKNGGERPELDMGRCRHGLLGWDPAKGYPKFFTEKGWEEILRRYGIHDPVIIRFQSSRLLSRPQTTDLKVMEPKVCHECCMEKLLDFESTDIEVLFNKDNIIGTSARTTRSKVKAVRVTVTKKTTVKDIKLMICAEAGISPIAQLLRYKDKDLESEQTVAELRILANDTLQCQVFEEDSAVVESVVLPNEGFGGTALVGALACPQCTLFNSANANICDACQYPFVISA